MISMMIIFLTVLHLFHLCITGKYASDIYYFMLKRCAIQMAEHFICSSNTYILNVGLNTFESLQNMNCSNYNNKNCIKLQCVCRSLYK